MREITAHPATALQRRCACGKPAPAGGECEECRRAREQTEAAAPQPTAVQRSPAAALAPPPPGDFSGVPVSHRARLAIGPVDDVYEREADRMAAEVMASLQRGGDKPAGAVVRRDAGQAVRRQAIDEEPVPAMELEDDDEDAFDEQTESRTLLQAKAAPGGLAGHAPPAVERYVAGLDGAGGRPLPTHARRSFEPRFGRDFGGVRVHTDSAAAEAARGVRATAFTVGRHVVFGAGRYAPDRPEGQRLLAHELTHVVQQSGGGDAMSSRIQRAPWGGCPEGVKLTGARPDRYAAAEFAALAYYHRQNPGHCIASNLDLFEELDCAGKEGKAFATHFRSGKNPRKQRIVLSPDEVPAGDPDSPSGLEDFEAHAGQTTFALLRPDIIDFTTREMYDVTTSGLAGAKRGKLTGYVKLARTITRRDWKAGQSLPRPEPYWLNFRIPTRSWSICFGPTDLDKRPGVIAYDVIGDEKTRKQDKEEEEKAKKKREEKQRKKEERERKKEEKRRKKEEAKREREKAKKEKKTAKEKGKKEQPKEEKPKEKEKEPPAASAGNIGFGLSIFGGGGGAANAGVGVSIMSNGHSYGTVGAGIVYNSDGVAVGSVGAGISSGSTAYGAGVAGLGKSKDDTTAGAGVAGAGSTEGNLSAGAGVAGKGSAKDNITATVGTAAKGDAEGQIGAQAGKSGTAAESQPGGGGTGKQAGKEGQGQGTGAGGAGQGGPGVQPGGTSTPAAGTAGTAGGAGKQRAGATGGPGFKAGAAGTAGGKGAGQTGRPGKLGLGIPGLTPAQADKAVEDAAKIAARLEKARPQQKALIDYLAKVSPDRRYLVPSETWVKMVLDATDGIKDEDLAYLITVNWTPGETDAAKLKEQAREALKHKGEDPSAPADKPTDKDKKPPPHKDEKKQGAKPAATGKKVKPDQKHKVNDAAGKKPASKPKAESSGAPAGGDAEPGARKETRQEYIQRLQQRAASYDGWDTFTVGKVHYEESTKAQSIVLYMKATPSKGGKEVRATCDVYGTVTTKNGKTTLHIQSSGVFVSEDGKVGAEGLFNGKDIDLL